MLRDYSLERKEGQERGEIPVWYTTAGWQMFAEKYLFEAKTVKEQMQRIARTFAKYCDESVKPDFWEQDIFTAGKTWEQVFFDMMWTGHYIPSTPQMANTGTTRGCTVSCLVGDSLINTRHNGVKKIKDMCVGDEVLTHKGRWKRVTNVQHRESTDDLYNLVVDSRKTKIHITGNHQVLTNVGWVRADELNPLRHLVATNGKIEYEAKELLLDLYSNFPRESYDVRTALHDNNVKVDEDLAWAFGLWFAEGSLNIDKGSQYGRTIRITMAQHEVEQLKKFGEIFKAKFGVNYNVAFSEHEGRKWATCNIGSKVLANYFGHNFGTSCLTKTIPTAFMEMPLGKLKAFLDGVYAGDGRKSSGIITTHVTPDIRLHNEALVAQLYDISLKLGYEVSVQLSKKDKRNTRNPVSTLVFNMGCMDDCVRTRAMHHRIKFQDGNVYCKFVLQKLHTNELVYDITVEEDHSFSVGGVIVHNCSGGYVKDSVVGFYDAYREAAVLTKHGFGTSYYLGDITPAGTVLPEGGKAGGVLPVLKGMIAVMEDITQTNRRGSVACSLEVTHKDFDLVADYVMLNPDGANIGWLITDKFMRKLNRGEKEAIRKWNKMLYIKMRSGRGYFVFIDKMNRHLAEPFKKAGLKVYASNLCVEVCLPANEEYSFSCVLSSLNLAKYREWSPNLEFLATVMLDCSIDDFLEQATGKAGMEKVVKFTRDFRALG